MNRKEFFMKSGRWVILSGIVGLSVFLARNDKVAISRNCSGPSLCRNCGKYSQCELPQANNQRNGRKES